jgi:hypothetical protein
LRWPHANNPQTPTGPRSKNRDRSIKSGRTKARGRIDKDGHSLLSRIKKSGIAKSPSDPLVEIRANAMLSKTVVIGTCENTDQKPDGLKPRQNDLTLVLRRPVEAARR